MPKGYRSLYGVIMKLKKTRKERKCYSCKSLINKGDL